MAHGHWGKGLVLGGAGAALLICGVLVAGIAWAGGPGGKGPGCRLEQHRAELVADLDLSEEQEAQLDGVLALLREHHEDHAAEREEHLGELLAALESGEIDDEAVHARIDAKLDEVRAGAHEIADAAIAFVRGLDADQRATLADRVETLHDRMQRWHDRGGPHGPGGPCGHGR